MIAQKWVGSFDDIAPDGPPQPLSFWQVPLPDDERPMAEWSLDEFGDRLDELYAEAESDGHDTNFVENTRAFCEVLDVMIARSTRGMEV